MNAKHFEPDWLKRNYMVNFKVLLLAVALAFATAYLKPDVYFASTVSKLQLEAVVPSQIGQWKQIHLNVHGIVTPEQKIIEEEIYSQVLERFYEDKQGYRIMLSIAYGSDQRDGLSLHQPTVCYPAQGFEVGEKERVLFDLDGRSLSVERMVAKYQSRTEPITFWSMIGEHPFKNGLEKKIQEMRYGFQGLIPDGLLIRVSSIDADKTRAYERQRAFLESFIGALPNEFEARFIGGRNG